MFTGPGPQILFEVEIRGKESRQVEVALEAICIVLQGWMLGQIKKQDGFLGSVGWT